MDVLVPALAGLSGAAFQWAAHYRRAQRTAPSLSERLVWGWLLEEGVLLNRDLSLTATLRFHGPDPAYVSAEELDALDRQLTASLSHLRDRWVIHVDAIHHRAEGYAPEGHFPAESLRRLDEERRRAYTGVGNFVTDTYLTLTFRPQRRAVRNFYRLFEDAPPIRENTSFEDHRRLFRKQLASVRRGLGRFLKIDQLDSPSLLRFLHHCATALDHPIHPTPEWVNPRLFEQEVTAGFEPVIGAKHFRVLAVTGFPQSPVPGQLDFLHRLPFEFRTSHRLIPLSREHALKYLNRRRDAWYNLRKSFRDIVAGAASSGEKASAEQDRDRELFEDEHALSMVEDINDALTRARKGNVFGFYTWTVLLWSTSASDADDAAQAALEAIRQAGYTARQETLNAFAAFAGSLPGHGEPNVRKPIICNEAFGSLIPLTGIYSGLAHNPSDQFPENSPPILYAKTEGCVPFRLNLHEADVGHTLLIGDTGAGKSVLLSLLAAQFLRYPNSQVFVLDVGRSSELLTLLGGGDHFHLTLEGTGLRPQPLADLDSATARAQAQQWLEALIQHQGQQVDPSHRGLIREALRDLEELPRDHRTISEFAVRVSSQELKEALADFRTGGTFGALFDSAGETLSENRLQTFELGELMPMAERILSPVMAYILTRITHNLARERPTLLLIDEAQYLLSHPFFGQWIAERLRTARKSNAAVLLATQTTDQILDSPHRAVLLSSCPTRILLPSPGAASPSLAANYEALGLGEHAREILAKAQKRRDYLISSPSGTRLFDLGLEEVALSLITLPPGVSRVEALAEARRLRETYPEDHFDRWLAYRGVGQESECAS